MRAFELLLIGSITGLLHLPALSATAKLNDTGTFQCVLSTGELSTQCQGTGQDAEFGRDTKFNIPKDGLGGFKFVRVCNSGEDAGRGACPAKPVNGIEANEWGCTRDMITGLTWKNFIGEGGMYGASTWYTNLGNGRQDDLSGLVAYAQAGAPCGFSDWRAPVIDELESIRALEGNSLDPNWFPNSIEIGFWSSNEEANNAHLKLADLTGSIHPLPYPQPLSVRLVRGETPKKGAFKAAGAVVTDPFTQLVWQRCAVGQQWNGKTCLGYSTLMDWRSALQAAADEAARTGVAWRLPNFKELLTISDFTRFNQAIDPKAFPNSWAPAYWSSSHSSSSEAWVTDGFFGYTFSLNMNNTMMGASRLVHDLAP